MIRFTVLDKKTEDIVLKCDTCGEEIIFSEDLGKETFSREQFVADCVSLATEEHKCKE